MDGMEKILLLGSLGLVAYWLTNKASAAVSTAHPSALPPNENVVVFNNDLSPAQQSAILRGSFVNGLAGYVSPTNRTAGPMIPPERSPMGSSPAMPVSMKAYAPVNEQWSGDSVINKTRPVIPEQNISAAQRAVLKAAGYIDAADAPKHAVSTAPDLTAAQRSARLTQNWQDKELAYARANPSAGGPWQHNADGTVSRGALTPPASIDPANAPVYYNGAYLGTAAQVANSQAALARGQTYGGHIHQFGSKSFIG